MILADLEEGVFPDRASVEPFLALAAGAEPDLASRMAYGREMCRFLHALGAARSTLTLVYPTTDHKGQEVLRAAFLDHLLGRLKPEAALACHTSAARFHPAYIEDAGLAGVPADARVRATALAIEQSDTSALRRLAGTPRHREAVQGIAAALRALQGRLRGTPYGPFEGLLGDAAAIDSVRAAFGPGCTYSASQLETYIACPFQFFAREVLKLKPASELDELEEDFTRRGSVVHDILEHFEKLIRDRGGEPAEGLPALASAAIEEVLRTQVAQPSDLDGGLQQMERQRLERVMAFYLAQREEYAEAPAGPPVPHLFEVAFGADYAAYPKLTIGAGDRSIQLRGRIDRIDLLPAPGGTGFRVIDYKTGKVPSLADVGRGVMVQLGLYAMAVEQLILGEVDGGPVPAGFGYWGLRKDGYREMECDDWRTFKEALAAHVLNIADQIRRGEFVVDSRNPGCESYCDYRSVCRVRQVRMAGKSRDTGDPEFGLHYPRRPRGG